MNSNNQISSLDLSSPVFKDGQPIPILYSFGGQNINPPLNISGAPNGAKSLALIMHDPDAIPVAGIDYVHWTLWNIPPTTQNIESGVLPEGSIVGINSGNENKYMGADPPPGSGIHHYIFELYALDTILDLPGNTNREQLEATMSGHTLDKCVLTGSFSKDA